jgi:hypothetical protein
MLSTRSTGGAVTASRSAASLAAARRAARVSAAMPAESQKVVAVMSTTRPSAPALSASSSSSRRPSALVTSTSAGVETTADWPDQVTGNRSSDTTITAALLAKAGRVSGPRNGDRPQTDVPQQDYADLTG